jgi:ferredoxin-NADP reductase
MHGIPVVAVLVAGGALVAFVALQLVLLGLSLVLRARDERRVRALEIARFEKLVEAAGLVYDRRLQSASRWNGNRKFVVARKVRESTSACSFYLKPHDGRPLPPFDPGQFLTFDLQIPDQSKRIVRCYSLSDSPSGDHYRVTIKRVPPPENKPDAPSGLVSSFFHDVVAEGDILDVRAPAGQFTIDLGSSRPVVLIAGGVGLTPVYSMLKAMRAANPSREVWLFYGVTCGGEQIFKQDLEEIRAAGMGDRLCVNYSAPAAADVEGVDYQHQGRVSLELLKRDLPSSNYEFYVCGPPAMMESVAQGLAAWGVPAESIHSEAFGPASVKPKPAAPAASGGDAAAWAVSFARSDRSASWNAGAGSLLDFAEELGIAVSSGCRAGNCGTCAVALRSGQVTYSRQPGCEVEKGSCLLCITVPASAVVLDA